MTVVIQPPASRAARRPLVTALVVVLALAGVKLLIHLLTATRYGIFIDELYFLAAGEHLAWGYVDMPPLTAAQAALARALFGDSLFGIRLLPALAGAGLVLIVGGIVRELRGGRVAQLLAGLGILAAGIFLMINSYLSMNAIEPLIWAGCAWVLIRLIKTEDGRWWLAFGALAGIGLLNNHTMLLFGGAAVLGMLLSPARRLLWSKWLLAGGALALALFLPNLIWMARHDFPMLELLANIRASGRNVALTPLAFMSQQILFLNPVTLPLWLGGLWYFFFHRQGRRFQVLGWTYLLILVGLLLTDGRVYYLASAYPMLLAGGAVLFERLFAGRALGWLKVAYPLLLVVGGVALAPIFLPLLEPEDYVRYTRAIGVGQPRLETHQAVELPQFFADRFGWPEMAQATADAYFALPAAQRAHTAIYTENYGQAGAIDFYGPALGLPKAISGHLNYFYWGPRDYTGESVLLLGVDASEARQVFNSVQIVGHAGHRYAMSSENFPILLATEPKIPLPELWPQVKTWQ